MPSSYTPSLRLVLPVTGELQGLWGDTVNNGLTSLVDAAIAGTADVAMTDANRTLSTNNELPDEARCMFINLTGTLTTTRDVICPAVSKLYFVHNGTNQSIVFKTAGGTGVTVVAGSRFALYCNATDVVPAVDDLPAASKVAGVAIVTVSGTQTLTNKTLSVDNNTVSGVAASSFVLSNASGNVDGSAAQKAIPAGVVVGTSDTQTLTNKTISGSTNTITNVSLTTGVTGTLPVGNGGTGITSLGTGVAAFLGTPTSENLAAAVTNETGSGALVFATSPTLVTPALGTPSSGTLTNATGLPIVGGTTGTLTVARGGTGATTLTANNVILGNGTSAPLFVAPGTTGNVLTSNGTTWTSAPGGGDVTLNGTQTLTNKTISADNNTLSGIAASSFVLSNGSGNIDGSAAQKAIPSGAVVGTTDTQTLTNKTISADNNTLSGIAASSFVLSNGSGNIDGSAAQKAIPSGVVVGTTDTQTLTNKTTTNLVFDGDYTEEVFTITDGASVNLDPANGTVQVWTLGASRSPTATGFDSGQSITLLVDDGTAYAITWPSVTWKTDGGAAPTLNTTGFTVIQLWKVSTVLYGARVGDA